MQSHRLSHATRRMLSGWLHGESPLGAQAPLHAAPPCPTSLFHSWLRAAQQPRQPASSPCAKSAARSSLHLARRPQLKESLRCAATAAVDAPVREASHPQLPKAFDPAEEQELYDWWEQQGFFKPRDDAEGEPFVVAMPPPNVTGKLHMGHAMFATLQDIAVRFHRMRGRPTLWIPGTDHAGIATQLVVEKQLAAEGQPSRQDLGREAFEAKVWEWKEQYGGEISRQLRRLGASCDWSRERFTLDTGLSEAVREAFVRLHAKGLVYRGSYLVNWSPNLQTAVSDLEVEYSEEPGTLYHFRYPVLGPRGEPPGDGDFLPVATTRPETILGDTAVAVHPGDSRYGHLVGRECEVPLSGGRRVPLIADEYVDPEFGTGALKITPGHDPNDHEIGRRRGLATLNIMADDGTLNAAAGAYAGLDRFEARKRLWADLQAAGLAIREEPYAMRVPRTQRGGEVVEPLVREQWFLRMGGLAQPCLQAVDRGELAFVPERFERVFRGWLEGIRDWCLSRQLWWGHRIPVWYVFPSEEAAEASPGGRSDAWVVARSEEEAQRQAEAEHGPGVRLRQETDVLDTWFSSALWPFSTLGWPGAALGDGGPQGGGKPLRGSDLARFYPTTLMETGHDIIFFWVARMAMMGLELTGRLPFSTVFLHGLVRDAQGRKMSKSLGNVVDPVDVLAGYGTDALRFTLATGTAPGQDLNLSLERVTANRNLTNKLWNAGKFLELQLEGVPQGERDALAGVSFARPEELARLPLVERWIVSCLHQTVDAVTEALERLEFGEAGRRWYEFFWSTYADWYVESAKAPLYGGDAAAQGTTRQVLVYCYSRLLALGHPLMPYVTEALWGAVPHVGPALIAAPWPTTGAAADAAALAQYKALQAGVTAIRAARAEYGVELGRRIPAALRVADAPLREALGGALPVLCALAKLDPSQVTLDGMESSSSSSSPSESPSTSNGASSQISLVVAEGFEVLIPLAGLFDVAKELARLRKQRERADKERAGFAGRLANPSFAAKAPPHVVAEARQQAAEAEQKLAVLDQKLAQMEALGSAG